MDKMLMFNDIMSGKRSDYMHNKINLKITGGLLLIIDFITGFFLTDSIISSSMNYNSESVHSLYYFTIQSNIMVFFWFIFISINLISNKRLFNFALKPNLTAILTTYILITGIIYWVVLVPVFYKPGGNNSWLFTPSNIWLHTLTPLTAVILLFLSKVTYSGTVPKRHLIFFLIYPIAYIIFGIFNALKGIYLYPMFNPVMLGNWWYVAFCLGVICIIFSILYLLMLRLYKTKN